MGTNSSAGTQATGSVTPPASLTYVVDKNLKKYISNLLNDYSKIKETEQFSKAFDQLDKTSSKLGKASSEYSYIVVFVKELKCRSDVLPFKDIPTLQKENPALKNAIDRLIRSVEKLNIATQHLQIAHISNCFADISSTRAAESLENDQCLLSKIQLLKCDESNLIDINTKLIKASRDIEFAADYLEIIAKYPDVPRFMVILFLTVFSNSLILNLGIKPTVLVLKKFEHCQMDIEELLGEVGRYITRRFQIIVLLNEKKLDSKIYEYFEFYVTRYHNILNLYAGNDGLRALLKELSRYNTNKDMDDILDYVHMYASQINKRDTDWENTKLSLISELNICDVKKCFDLEKIKKDILKELDQCEEESAFKLENLHLALSETLSKFKLDKFYDFRKFNENLAKKLKELPGNDIDISRIKRILSDFEFQNSSYYSRKGLNHLVEDIKNAFTDNRRAPRSSRYIKYTENIKYNSHLSLAAEVAPPWDMQHNVDDDDETIQ